ncbi:MAG: FAD-dependent oxidoreductase, partial [Sediminispirochaetaceae bacterium]
GGNAAVDAARTAIRLGAEEVTILYRRTQEQMPAYAEEIEEALLEGVKLKTLTQPITIERNGVGKVKGVTCACMKLGEFDRSGRRRPTHSEEKNFIVEADQVIVAIGQKLDPAQFSGELDIQIAENRFIRVNPITGQSSVDWIFAGGDAVSGPVSVVAAIGAGEKAAVGIDEYLTGENNAFWREDKVVDTSYDPDAEASPYKRTKLPVIDVDRRVNNFEEVERSWCENEAIRQCERCLRCDYGKTPVKRENNS